MESKIYDTQDFRMSEGHMTGQCQGSLFQAPREKRAGEDEGTKTRGTGGEKKAGKKRSL